MSSLTVNNNTLSTNLSKCTLLTQCIKTLEYWRTIIEMQIEKVCIIMRLVVLYKWYHCTISESKWLQKMSDEAEYNVEQHEGLKVKRDNASDKCLFDYTWREEPSSLFSFLPSLLVSCDETGYYYYHYIPHIIMNF